MARKGSSEGDTFLSASGAFDAREPGIIGRDMNRCAFGMDRFRRLAAAAVNDGATKAAVDWSESQVVIE